MNHIAIRADSLSKRYRVGERLPYRSLRESLSRIFYNSRKTEDKTREIWALQNITFELKHGEVLAIIGRNGAGKSTLLKIIGRITTPTSGRAEIFGRVGSLLEVGTGFHPELTGRENVFLNGAILGMRREEIRRRFDEIIAFANTEHYVDTPVKRYSSGMRLRLAFAVAAHLDTEILLIDEVLAVGDHHFQKRCLGKMRDVASSGRTVVFVSHNLAAVSNLCTRGILLDRGQIIADGLTEEVVEKYIEIGRTTPGFRSWNRPQDAPGDDLVRLHAVRILSDRKPTSEVAIDKPVVIEIEYWNLSKGTDFSVSIHLLDKMGVPVLASANMHSANLGYDDFYCKPLLEGLYRTSCEIPANFLNDGTYSINVFVLKGGRDVQLSLMDAVSFTVVDTGTMRKEYSGYWLGMVRPRLRWWSEHIDSKDDSESGELRGTSGL